MLDSVLSDESDEAVSMTVVRRVARAARTEAASLPPLYDSIDPEALDAVVGSTGTVSVTFSYAGYDVTVDADGSVSVDSGDE